jgi:hypothetical protein
MKPNPNERREEPPQRPEQPRQQQSSDGQQQQQDAGGGAGQYGEGNYKATRDYDRGVKEHMQSHDVEREARDAAPRSDAEEKEMQDAERQGRSRAKGGGEEDMRREPEAGQKNPD